MKALVLSMMMIFFLVLFSWVGKAAEESLEEYLVLYFSFGEGLGDTVKDISENKHMGTLMGDGIKWTQEGKFGSALDFNGVNGYVNVKDDASLSFALDINGVSITIIAWMFPGKVDQDFRWIVDKSFAKDGNPSYMLGISSNNKARFTTRKLANDVFGPVIVPERWYHIAGVQDVENKTISLYLDGFAVVTAEITGEKVEDKETDLKIGGRNWAGGGAVQYFGGIIDEVAIFKCALTADEIKKSMQGVKRLWAVTASGKLPVIWAAIKTGK